METVHGKKIDIPFRVALEIYRATEIEKNPIWFTRLTERLSELSKRQILRSLNTLTDWSIVKGQYGATTKGRAGRLYFICSESKRMLKELNEEVT